MSGCVLFVALDLPEPVREAMSEVTRRFQKIYPGARWLPLEAAHVTLKFIGEVSPEKADRIREALRGVHQHLPPGPIEMRFAGVGFFPNARRPKVLWAGVSGMETSTIRAAESGAATTGAAEGRGCDDRRYKYGEAQKLKLQRSACWPPRSKPRSSPGESCARLANSIRISRWRGLIRCRVSIRLRDAAGQLASHEFGSATAGEFHLYRSVLKPTGAEYTRLDTYPLLEKRPDNRSEMRRSRA